MNHQCYRRGADDQCNGSDKESQGAEREIKAAQPSCKAARGKPVELSGIPRCRQSLRFIPLPDFGRCANHHGAIAEQPLRPGKLEERKNDHRNRGDQSNPKGIWPGWVRERHGIGNFGQPVGLTHHGQ